MSTLPFSKIRTALVILAFLLVAGAIGYQLGEHKVSLSVVPATHRVMVNQEPPPQANVDFSLFWDVWQRLFRYYIDAAHLDPQKMVTGAIIGMVNSLDDPYTAFLPPKENKDFKEDLGGSFDGIGAQLGLKEGRIIVVAPLKGMPAEKAGIRAGDFILKVNDEETINWTVQQAVTKIRGPRGTSVTLSILHENGQKPVDLTIQRSSIEVPSVEWWVKDSKDISEISGITPSGIPGSVAYIRLTRFGDRTSDEWNKAIKELLADLTSTHAKGIIFDLRNNPGGYLEGSVFIASEFIKNGTVVTQVNSDGSKQAYTVNRTGSLLSLPMVVLINKGSASAAEIVAGALRDFGRAKLVGETSFGKGSVQTPQELPGGAGLHITTGKWLLPKGDWINKVGIKPDVEVAWDGADATADAQLAKAVELLLQ